MRSIVNKTVKVLLPGHPWAYKDESYRFEDEVRAMIEFEPSHQNADLSDEHDLAQFTPNISVKIDNDFIEDIQIDERCKDFKKDVFRSIIEKHGHKMSESRIFSSLER